MTSKSSPLSGDLLTGVRLAPAAPKQIEPRSPDRLFRHLEHRVLPIALRVLLSAYAAAMAAARVVGRRRRAPRPDGLEILVTGTFHSGNWVRSHLLPLAAASPCARVRVVSTLPIPAMPKVEAVYPPAWLVRAIGGVPARLVVFTWLAVRTRPDIVGGFHLLFNGLVAALVGRLAGARSLYFCVGGPAEIFGGGVTSENRLFGRLRAPDLRLQQHLIDAIGRFDLCITMGQTAAAFLRTQCVSTRFHVVAGGIDAERFARNETTPVYDLALVARLAPIKQIDLFLQSVARVRAARPAVKAVIVGDGPLMEPLQRLARELGVDGNVTFAGRQTNVDDWLRRSRVFVLTSQSEGLALSMMEAMICGLPAIVPDVGDLRDLVEDGVTGYLVSPSTPERFAARMLDLIARPSRLAQFGTAARAAALRYDVGATTRIWERLLAPEGV